MGFRIWNGIFAAIALFSLVACKIKLPENQVIIDANASLSCVANISNGQTFGPGQPVVIQVTAQNGSAPYTITGIGGTFSSFTSITRTYQNISSNQIVISDQVAVSDSDGRNAICSFNVNVTAIIIDPNPLTCQISATPSSAQINQNVVYSMTASGGGNTVVFSNFQAGANSSIVSALTSTGNKTASATASYSASGVKTASVVATDSLGNVAACSKDTTVAAVAAVAVSASPASSVPIGSSITLTAVPSGFVGSTVLSFATTESGVQITMLSATSARIDAIDNLPHANFNVSVSAISATQTASNSIALSFTGSAALNCSITYASGTYRVGDTVTVNVVASNNESLNITYFSAPGATEIPSFAAFPKPLKYSSPGIKFMYAQARSAVTGQLCNGGAVLQTSIDILPSQNAVGCSVATSPNPQYAGYYFNVVVTPTSNNGYQRIYMLEAYDVLTGASAYGEWVYTSSPLRARAVMWNRGTYNLKVTIVDELSGNTSSCVTQQQIY